MKERITLEKFILYRWGGGFNIFIIKGLHAYSLLEKPYVIVHRESGTQIIPNIHKKTEYFMGYIFVDKNKILASGAFNREKMQQLGGKYSLGILITREEFEKLKNI